MKKINIIIALLGLAVIALIGTFLFMSSRNDTQVQETETADELTKISVYKGSPVSPQQLIVKIIIDQKLGEKHGLEIEWREAPSAESFRLLQAGEIDISTLNPLQGTLLNASSQPEQRATIFGKAYNAHTVIVVPDESPIKTPEDLVGKKVATFSVASQSYQLLRIYAAQNNLDPESDLILLSLPGGAVIPTMIKGDADAVGAFSFNVILGDLYGKVREIVDLSKHWNENISETSLYTGLAARDDWLKENKNTAKAFRDAWYEASQYILDNPEVLSEKDVQDYIGLENPSDEVVNETIEIYNIILPRHWNSKDIENTKEFITKSSTAIELPENYTLDFFSLLE